jgi:hypothetical protein
MDIICWFMNFEKEDVMQGDENQPAGTYTMTI